MNPVWSELNKTMQPCLRKESTFDEGIRTLLTLRDGLIDALVEMKHQLKAEDFYAMPFPSAKGYHSKTIAYSIWHIARIEDIVAHDLILRDSEIFYTYLKRIGSPLITTGNELVGEQIARFSEKLDINELYAYAAEVKSSTDEMLKKLSYGDLKRRFYDTDKERLRNLHVVSTDENACWLIDYWCGKDIRGLIEMPFSRHIIMHVEASLRIKNKITSKGKSL